MQQLKKFDEALEIYSSLDKVSTQLKDFDYNIGLCYYHLQDLENAIDYMKKFLYSHPSNFLIYTHLCKALLLTKRYQEINEVCSKAEMWRIKNIPFRLWAYSLIQLKDMKKAHNVLILSLSHDEKNLKLWLLLGKVLSKCGYSMESLCCYEKVLNLDNNSIKAKKNINRLIKTIKGNSMHYESRPITHLDFPLLPEKTIAQKGDCDYGCTIT